MKGRLHATSTALAEGSFDHVEVAKPSFAPFGGDGSGHVGEGARGVGHLEGVKFAAHEAAPRGPLRRQYRDMARNARPTDGKLMAADRAERRVFHGRVGSI